MLASTWYDLVMGVDLHFELVPTPAGPVPTPFPHPFVGLVFDPMGLLVGLAISNTIGMIAGGSFKGPVLINGMVATNTGTEATNKLGVPHIVIPPGVSWAPMMRVPVPPIKPGETPEPELPLPPPGDAILITGSQTVKTMGSNQCRLGDLALSCSDPVRMPSSTLLTIPKGRPVLIGGPPALDYLAAALGMLRSKWISTKLNALINRLKNARLRSLLSKVVCFFTGHPVNVSTGSLMTWATDLALPGPIPFRLERNYASHWSDRSSPLGYGWSHSYDQALWEEPGKMVYRAEDGRELEFDTFNFAQHRMAPGDVREEPLHRLKLRCLERGCWEIEAHSGMVHRFAPVSSGEKTQTRLLEIKDRLGSSLQLRYDHQGLLTKVIDSAGRSIGYEHDVRGRLVRVHAPQPTGTGEYIHTRYVYSGAGDLIEVHDALGNISRYDYDGHLMVQETDRTGLSFYFVYDGMGPEACCTRTWGDGGIFDHELVYDKAKHITLVTNSLGATTLFESNAAFAVTRVVDAHGNETLYAYDDDLRKVEARDPLGHTMRYYYDEQGNQVATEAPDGTRLELQFNGQNLPTRAKDALGGEWTWRHDRYGRVVEASNPLSEVTRLQYEGPFLTGLIRPDGATFRFEYDGGGNVTALHGPGGLLKRLEYNRLGQCVVERDGYGQLTRFHPDLLGRITLVEAPEGIRQARSYDGEGNLLQVHTPNHRIAFSYTGYHKLATRTEDHTRVELRYDTEDRVVEVLNEAGLGHRFVRNLLGQVTEEHGFDGKVQRTTYDAAGRVSGFERPSGRTSRMMHDGMGRLSEVIHDDGSFTRFKWNANGKLISAENADVSVELVRDSIGRIVEEVSGSHRVLSHYGTNGLRDDISTSEGLSHFIQRDGMGRTLAHEVQFQGHPTAGWRVTLTRASEGLELRRLLPGGLEATWQWDAVGRPLHRLLDRPLRGRNPAQPGASSPALEGLTGAGHVVPSGAGGGRLEATSYQWRGEDQLATVDDMLLGLRSYTHDGRGRLTRMQGADGRESLLKLDVVGNLYRRSDQQDRQYSVAGTLERLEGTMLEYDGDGNLSRRTLEDGRCWQYRYNAEGHLAEVEKPDGECIRFKYDPFGRRIRKESNDSAYEWIWDRDVLVHELRSGVAEQVLPIRSWIFESESFTPLAQIDGFQWYSVHADHLGTPQALYDDEGRLGWRTRLDLTGAVEVEESRRTSCPFRYPGQYADEETGLYYNRFRYYDPVAGRYISQDPIGLEGGLRPYGYATDPLLEFDALGLILFYHGTNSAGADQIGNGIDLGSGRNALDFNPANSGGFYVTNNYTQAVERAQRQASRRGGTATVLVFDIPESALESLNGQHFASADDAWAAFVREGRANTLVHSFDFVEGPMLLNPFKPAQAARGSGHQLAIFSDRAARTFDDNLVERRTC